jgi:hypothetical protein
MSLSSLAAKLSFKYAQELPDSEGADTSFGVPINAKKTRLLKDRLILVYDRLAKNITQLPSFIEINNELGKDHLFKVFKSLIDLYVANIEGQTLKENFNYSVKIIDALNDLRNVIIKMKYPRDKMYRLDEAIQSIQEYIWKHTKALINVHDLRGVGLDTPEANAILQQKTIPTWHYGPIESPVKGRIKRPSVLRSLLNRLDKEIQEEEQRLTKKEIK